MVDPKPAPLAKSAPKERVDTGAVDPTSYVPQSKVAPEPAIASGIGAAVESEETLPELSTPTRSPRPGKATVASVVKSAKSTVESVKGAVDRVREVVSSGRPISDNELTKAIRAKDEKCMRAVKRYRKSSDDGARVLLGLAFKAEGYKDATEVDIEEVFAKLRDIKVFAGYKVTKRGDITDRILPIVDVFPYTLGTAALDVEMWSARQWINHPKVADFFIILAAVVRGYLSTVFGESIIKAHMELKAKASADRGEPIKAEATIHDARDIVEAKSE